MKMMLVMEKTMMTESMMEIPISVHPLGIKVSRATLQTRKRYTGYRILVVCELNEIFVYAKQINLRMHLPAISILM